MAGKTTLVDSLKREAGLKVSEDEPERTAGIVSSSFKSQKYGQVTAYDFAGHPEYYASHEVVMQSILSKLPPLVLLNVKLCTDKPEEKIKDEEVIKKEVLYWYNFIKNRLAGLSRKSHIIIILSHADIVGKVDEVKLNKNQ